MSRIKPKGRSDRRPLRTIEVTVEEVVQETYDTVTLVFSTGDERIEYEAGQFLTIDPHQFAALGRFIAYFEDVKERHEPTRAYSMSSSPHERWLAVTVKEELYVTGTTKYPPLLSPFLVRDVRRGMPVLVTGFTGRYTLPRDIESRTDHIVHLCAGSGSVPNFSILKFALESHPPLRHTFVYSNKTWDDVIFRDELTELERRHPDRLHVVHALTRERDLDRGLHVHSGRISTALLQEVIPDPGSCRVFVCGPAISAFEKIAARETGVPPSPRFMETALACLEEIGISARQITREAYG